MRLKTRFLSDSFYASCAALALAGCATMPQAPTASASETAQAETRSTELAAFFEAYNQAGLAMSPETKAYRGKFGRLSFSLRCFGSGGCRCLLHGGAAGQRKSSTGSEKGMAQETRLQAHGYPIVFVGLCI